MLGGKSSQNTSRPAEGRGQGRGRSDSQEKDQSTLSSLVSLIAGGKGGGRLRDPKTYLFLAAGSWLLQWLEKKLDSDENSIEQDDRPGQNTAKGGI